jgi:hypothetical protein
VALRRLPIRDPDRSEPEHSRRYDPSTGGWTAPAHSRPHGTQPAGESFAADAIHAIAEKARENGSGDAR